MAGTRDSLVARNVLVGNLNVDNPMQGSVGTAFNPTYALVNEAGAQIVLFISSVDYKMYVQLKDKYGNLIYTSNIIDLPLESVVMNGRYDSITKEVVLTLVNGNEIRFSVADLVRGLIDEDRLEEVLGGYWSKEELTEEDIENWNNKQDYLNQGENIQIYSDLSLKGQIQQDSTILPSEYQQVEYIESSGTQYINTGLVGNLSLEISGEITPTDLSRYNYLIGSRDGDYRIFGLGIRNTKMPMYALGSQFIDSPNALTENTKYSFRTYLSNGSQSLYINDTKVAGSTTSISLTNTKPFYLFALNINGSANLNESFIGKLYNLKIKQNNSLVRDYIPCYRINDNEIGLYDLVNEVFYTNQGTGTFTKGNNITLPTPDYPQEIHNVSGDNTIEICGKNLFDKNNANIVVNKYLASNGSEIGGSTTFSISAYIKVQPNTIYSMQPFRNMSACLCFYNSSKTFISSIPLSNINQTFTTPNNCEYIRTTFKNEDKDIFQIEKSSTATTYEAYTGNSQLISLGSIELLKIGDYKDYIYRQDNRWYLHKEIGKVVLNGSEDIATNSDYISIGRFNITSISGAKGGSSGNPNAISTHFKSKYETANGNVYVSTNTNICLIDTDYINNVAGFKTWLGNNNPIVYYILATPTDTEITGALQEQLNSLSSMLSNNWIENISQENNDLPFLINYDNTKLTIDVPCANADQGGVIKTSDSYATATADGILTSQTKTYAQYNSLNNNAFVSKGTLENVITGKELVNKTYVDEADAIFENDLFGEDTVEGQGTDITLDNTTDAPIQLELKPNTHQDSTTGKNKIHYTTGSSYLSNLVVTENTNGSINISGTPNRTWANLTPDIQYTIPTGTYTFSINNTLPFRLGIRLFNSESDYMSYTIEANNTKTTFTTTKNYSYYRLFFEQLNTSTSYSINNLELQLETGSSATNWEKYTGGNPAPNPDFPMDIHCVTGDNTIKIENRNLFDVYPGTTVTSANVQFTRNNNGTITINGTSNTVGYVEMLYDFRNGTAQQSTPTLILNSSNTYKVSLNKLSGTTTSEDIRFVIQYDSVGNQLITYIGTSETISNSNGLYRAYLRIPNGATFNNLVVGVQIEKGSTSTDYVPHQGNSQLISLPVENLFDKSLLQQGNIDFGGAGTEATSSTRVRSGFISVQPNTQYTLSNRNTIINQCGIGLYKSDNSYDSSHKINNGSWNNFPITFTTQNDTFYIRMSFKNSSDTNITPNLDYKIQLEKGTKSNSYTPYGTTPIEYCEIGDYKDEFIKSTGKNLFDKDTANFVKGYYLNASGIETAGENWGVYYIPLISNKSYTISGCQPNGGVNFCWFDKNKTFISNIGQKQNRTITSPSNAEYLGLSLVWNASITGYDSQLMLNEGPTALFYEPYGAKWYLKKNTKKVVLDGSETLEFDSNSLTYIYKEDNIRNYNAGGLVYCNYYLGNAIGGSPNVNLNAWPGNAHNINIKNNSIANLNDFKFWLSTHNTEVHYVLATPEYILLNDTLQEQLDNLQRLLSYDGQTNISQENNDLPFKIKVSAFKDTTKGNISGLYAQIGDISSILDIINGEEV